MGEPALAGGAGATDTGQCANVSQGQAGEGKGHGMGMELTDAERELVRLWRAMDERGRRDVMDLAEFEAEASREARTVGWRVVAGKGEAEPRGMGVARLAEIPRSGTTEPR